MTKEELTDLEFTQCPYCGEDYSIGDPVTAMCDSCFETTRLEYEAQSPGGYSYEEQLFILNGQY